MCIRDRSKNINSGFISRIALKLDEFPKMKMYWREGHSASLHTPDMLSRALYEYDGSIEPEEQGYTLRCPDYVLVTQGTWRQPWPSGPLPCTEIRSGLRHLAREPLPVPQQLPIIATISARNELWASPVSGERRGTPRNENQTIRQPECAARRTACLLYTSPSPRDVEESRMPSSA